MTDYRIVPYRPSWLPQLAKAGLPAPVPHKKTPLQRWLKSFRAANEESKILLLTAGDQVAALLLGHTAPLEPAQYQVTLLPAVTLDGPALLSVLPQLWQDLPDAGWLALRAPGAAIRDVDSLLQGAPEPFQSDLTVHSARDWMVGTMVPQQALTIRLSRAGSNRQAVRLLPFAFGLLVIAGDETALTAIEFWRPKTPAPQIQAAWTAAALGYLAKDQTLLLCEDWPAEELAVLPAHPLLDRAVQQLRAYFAGELQVFDLPYRFEQGTPFQQRIWQAIARIPYGVTWTYSELAEAVAEPGQTGRNLARAAGAACGANPLAIVIPCHRVIGKNRDLVGFAGGVDIKASLLDHEMLDYPPVGCQPSGS